MLMTEQQFTESDAEFLCKLVDDLPDHISSVSPSQWAERNRRLPRSVTSVPGPFSYDLTPYLREIVDCVDIRSPIREINFMKGAQVGWTSGVLENAIGYMIEVVKSAPCMFLTADAELAKLRVEAYITPMIQQSGLAHLIQSGDELSNRKNGKTDKKIEWMGGGFLLPFGAKNAAKLRSFSIRCLLGDEIDGFPDKVGKDGDPMKLAEARCKGYQQQRKVLRGSTPLEKGSSRIATAFKDGDQRYYFLKCLGCGEEQHLRFSGDNDGHKFGLTYERDENGHLLRETVRYRCQFCDHDHHESDKTAMFLAGRWKPTAKPKNKQIRSYHLSGLYSPPLMFTWADCVQSYLDAWDVDNNKAKSMEGLQEFYNNVLGKAFERRSARIKMETISAHKRREYLSGQFAEANQFSEDHCGGHICAVTCAVDVHDHHLDWAIFGWAPGKRAVLIDEGVIKGDCTTLAGTNDDKSWDELSAIIEKTEYLDNKKRTYKIEQTLVDAGHNQELVLEFCGQYKIGVTPILGRKQAADNQRVIEFGEWVTPLGQVGYRITVDIYKQRWSGMLRREWDGMGDQPFGFFNAPHDITEKRLRELTVETKQAIVDKETNRHRGWMWHRPNGAANELWDLLVYNSAAFEMLAYDKFINEYEEKEVDWTRFYEMCADGMYFVEL